MVSTARADFAKRFIDSFFSAETRTLFTLLMNSALEFSELNITDENGTVIDNLPYLKIKKDVVNQLKGLVFVEENRIGYSAFEVDDFLLGFFDDIGWYEKRKLVDFETVKQAFGYYIIKSYENEQITQYLKHKDNEGKYLDFKYIYNKLNK